MERSEGEREQTKGGRFSRSSNSSFSFFLSNHSISSRSPKASAARSPRPFPQASGNSSPTAGLRTRERAPQRCRPSTASSQKRPARRSSCGPAGPGASPNRQDALARLCEKRRNRRIQNQRNKTKQRNLNACTHTEKKPQAAPSEGPGIIKKRGREIEKKSRDSTTARSRAPHPPAPPPPRRPALVLTSLGRENERIIKNISQQQQKNKKNTGYS